MAPAGKAKEEVVQAYVRAPIVQAILYAPPKPGMV